MRTEVITAATIDEAVERILKELKEDAAGTTGSSSRHNVIYFDGWDGLGASAVLRAVGRRLATPAAGSQEKEPSDPAAAAGLEFPHIFHIDCSKWESRRTMQRLIAEQLKLPASVMDMFDAQDEEDDYQGVGKGSRPEISQIAVHINRQIQKLNHRFLLIFHNGSHEEIDLGSLGFLLFDQYSTSKVLWSFQGRFRLYPRTKVNRALKNSRTTEFFLSAAVSRDIEGDKLSDILYHEAEEVARQMVNTGGIDWPAASTNIFLYMMKLCRMGNDLTDYDLVTHGCNYWKCDAIIDPQQGDVGTSAGVDRLWLSSEALQREMQLDADYYKCPSDLPCSAVRQLSQSMPHWTSPTFGIMLIQEPHGQISKGTFKQFDKLCVLKLSACRFSFTSPPFLCCHNLKFLWLDHCRDGSSINEVKEEDINQFLQRLWVLDVRHSNNAFLSKEMMDFMTQLRELNVLGDKELWHVNLVQSQLHNIHKLRIKETTVDSRFLFSGMDKMKLLELSRNYTINEWSKIYVKSCRSLETIIINGFDDLVDISLSECAKLKNILLRGSFGNLRKIVIIGAGVETLDLSAVTVSYLDELCLLDCEKLCAIFWPPAEGGRKRYMDRLRIDTTQREGTTEVSCEHITGKPPSKFDWHITVRDARILQSLESVKDYFSSNHVHVEISSPSYYPYVDDVGSRDDKMKSSGQHVQENLQQQLIMDTPIYADVTTTLKDNNKQQKHANEGDIDAAEIMCICPPPPSVPSQGCYIHIEDQTRAKLQAASTTIPTFICDSAKILQVHDSLHITSVLAAPLASPTWNQLEWCLSRAVPQIGMCL
ncbi:hypothetical protein EJB05_29048 [Eragrostis curvula]|uniref:NB-ARC domain-containing protein n=1 Tax=Eragrostis curvula TaxID=38414 RepID=A0A5J9UT84_9POAL|nr:hypothetical protein EJB05_29048 [Eragrostis curvula]